MNRIISEELISDLIAICKKSHDEVAYDAEKSLIELPLAPAVDLSGVKYVPGAMCKKHLVNYRTRDGGGGYTVQYCPKCDEENNPFRDLTTLQPTSGQVGECPYCGNPWAKRGMVDMGTNVGVKPCDHIGHRNQPNRTVSKMETVAGHVEVLPDFEDALESAFWDFDARHKAKDGPSERDAFKQVLRGLFSAGIDPESRGIRAELLARRMEVESQSKIIESLRTQPQASVVDVPSVDWIEKGLIEMGHVGPAVRLTAEHVHAILQSKGRWEVSAPKKIRAKSWQGMVIPAGWRIYIGSIGCYILTNIICGNAFHFVAQEQLLFAFFTLPAWFGIWAAVLWRK